MRCTFEICRAWALTLCLLTGCGGEDPRLRGEARSAVSTATQDTGQDLAMEATERLLDLKAAVEVIPPEARPLVADRLCGPSGALALLYDGGEQGSIPEAHASGGEERTCEDCCREAAETHCDQTVCAHLDPNDGEGFWGELMDLIWDSWHYELCIDQCSGITYRLARTNCVSGCDDPNICSFDPSTGGGFGELGRVGGSGF